MNFSRVLLYAGTVMVMAFISCNSPERTSPQDLLLPIDHWEQPAAGVWKVTIGNDSPEMLYTDLAAEPPRLESLDQMGPVNFPFEPGDIRYGMLQNGKIQIRVPCDPDEKIYGFGLQLDGLDHTKEVMQLSVDHWNRGGGKTHAPVPFYVSSKGYGVFFNTASYLKVYVATGNRKDASVREPEVDRNPPPDEISQQPGEWNSQPRGDAVEATVQASGMELVVFAGQSPLEVVQRYNLYCGGGALPPLWGLGFWHRMHAQADADAVIQEVADFEKHAIPLDVIGLEPGWMTKSYPCTYEWQKKRFADPAGFSQALLQQGIRLNLWINPYISEHAGLYKPMYPLSGTHMVWLGLVPDYTLPQARESLREQFQSDHIDIGISGYKVDEVDGYDRWLWPDHATFPSGHSAAAMRQTYGMQMQKTLYDGLFKQKNQRTYGKVRATNGAASAFPFVMYSDSYNHAEYITGISAASLSGILWSPELRKADSAREWLNRMQTVCFSHLAQLNAWASGEKPWSYPEMTDSVREVIELRMRLLPYLYTAFAEYHLRGTPPIRAMILEDERLGAINTVKEQELDGVTNPYSVDQIIEKNDQFMFGPDILVAPFYGPEYEVEREVILPSGNWYDFYTGDLMGNGENIRVTAEQTGNRIPLYVREGAVIPMLAEPVRKVQAAMGAALVVRHYGTTAGACMIYEDDTNTFNYQRGDYGLRSVSVGGDGLFSVEVVKSGPKLFGEIRGVEQMSLRE